jgi:hypothetical protein
MIEDGPLLELEPRDLRLLEAKGLGDLDTDDSGLVRRALGRIGGAVSGLFGKVRSRATRGAERRLSQIQKTFVRELLDLASRHERGTLRTDRFLVQARNKLRSASSEAFYLGVGSSGLGVLTKVKQWRVSKANKAWLEGAIQEELGHFDKLLGQVRQGKVRGALKQRAQAYADAFRHLYYAGRIVASPMGTAIDWIAVQDRNTCAGCAHLAKSSPYTRDTLPTTPRAGITPCHSNCRCRLVMRQVSSDVLQKIQQKHKRGKDWQLRKLEALKQGRRIP